MYTGPKTKRKKRPKRNSWNTKKDEEPGRADIYVRARVNTTHYSCVLLTIRYSTTTQWTLFPIEYKLLSKQTKNRSCLSNSIKFIFLFVFFQSIAFVGAQGVRQPKNILLLCNKYIISPVSRSGPLSLSIDFPRCVIISFRLGIII